MSLGSVESSSEENILNTAGRDRQHPLIMLSSFCASSSIN